MDSQTLPTVQIQILQYLYRFRFLTTHQLQTLLNHKNIRLTNYHLSRLTGKNIIAKHYSRSLGLANQPAVYFLSSGSIKFLEGKEGFEKRALKRVPKEKYRSKQFIDHNSFIAHFYLHLQNDSIKSDLTFYFFTKTDLLAHPYLIHPLPDSYFARTDKKGNTKRYLVEILDDSSPRFALRKRIDQYNDYIESGKFEEATRHPFPTLLFICPGIASLIYLKKHLSRIYEETSFDQTQVYLTTREDAFVGKWEGVEMEEN